MRIVLEASAQSEMWEAVRFYEDSREGLGSEFLDAIDHAIDVVRLHPSLGSPLKGRFRRVFLRRFPYAVHFLAAPEAIVVLAVFHTRRDPRHLEGRS